MPKAVIKPIRVFHANMVTTLIYVANAYIDTYSSPTEDELLEKGIFKENTYPFFVSFTFLMAMLSGVFLGPVCEWLGCKTVLIIFSPFSIIGSLLLVLGLDPASMVLAKGLIGVYSGLGLSCTAIYNSEVSPPNMRKFYGSLLGVAIRFGTLACSLLGIWLNFRWLALVYMIIVSSAVLNLIFLPESPKWLRNHGYLEDARKANKYFHDDAANYEYWASVKYINLDIPLKQKLSSYFVWPVIRPLLVCCSIHTFKTSSGYELLIAYSSHTLEKGVDIDPKVVSLFYGVFLLFGSILFVCISHKINWKWLIMVTTFIQFLCNALLGLVFYLSLNVFECSNNSKEVIMCDILGYSPILLVSCYGFAMALGWGSLSYWLIGEIIHQHYSRVSAGIMVSVSYMVGYLNEIIAPLIVEYVGTGATFFVYAGLCLVGLFVQCFY